MPSERTKDEKVAAEIYVTSERIVTLISMLRNKTDAFQAIAMAIGNLSTPDTSIDKTLKLISGVARAVAWSKHGTSE